MVNKSEIRLEVANAISALNNKADINLGNSVKASEIESIANSAASAAESANTVANAANTLINTTVTRIDQDLNTTKSWVTDELNKFKTNNTAKAYITETYSDGSNWYRVYSDGWKEQGGFIDYSSSINATKYKDVTLTFHLAFSNTNYNLQLTSNRTNCYAFEGDSDQYNYTNNRTTSSTIMGFRNVNIEETSTGNKRAAWVACGY